MSLSSQEILRKLSQVVQHEVMGLHWRTETMEKLRKRLFCPQVLDSPQLNQRESMEVFRKHEMRERDNIPTDELPPLHFGGEDEPMSDAQLASVMALRGKRGEDESPTRKAAAQELGMKGWSSDLVQEQLSESARQRLAELKQRVSKELSLDRYEDLAVQAEELMANHIDQLYADGGWEPGKTPPELVCNLGDDPFALKEGALHPDLPGDEGKEKERSERGQEMKRSQSVRSMRDSTVAVRRERERREAEIAERRRRDELLEKYIAAPLPEAYRVQSFDTSLVSPALDRLAPSDGERRLLPPLKHLKQQVKMKTPKALADLALSPQSKAQEKKPLTQAARQTSKPSGTSSAVERQALRAGAKVNLSMDASNLKEEVVTQRLQQHADAFRDSSFDNVKKETDILTGQRRQRLDAAALERDERTFIERIEGLVGNKSTPAIRQLRPTLKKTKSMPKLLGQRVPDSKPKLAGKPTAVLEQISRQMAQEVRAETLEINMEVEKVTWTQVSAGNLLGGLG